MESDFPGLEHSDGVARLFPLPNLVIFPFIMQGLHIFEPRYRQMTADALASDRLIAMAVLRPGWEADYQGKPDLYSVACMGRIVADHRRGDGRYDLQFRGLSRVRLGPELVSDKLYRIARVELLEDIPIKTRSAEQEIRDRLAQALPRWCAAQPAASKMFQKLLQGELLLGIVCDVLAYALSLTIETKQQLLETPDVEQRAVRLLAILASGTPSSEQSGDKPQFPPDFSIN